MIVAPNVVKDIGRVFFWFPLRWFVLLTPYGIIPVIGRFLGLLDYYVFGRGRARTIERNMTSSLDLNRDEAAKRVQDTIKVYYTNILEFIKYPAIERGEHLGKYISYEGIDYLTRGLERGKGVILLTAHFGAKQILQVGLGKKGYRVNQIHYHMDNGELSMIQKHVSQKYRKRIENGFKVNFIPANGFQRKTLKCLHANEILIVAGDGSGLKNLMNPSYKPCTFLGKKMLFPQGPHSVALKTGTQIIPTFVVREGAKHRIVFEAPFSFLTGNESVDASMEYYINLLEEYIRSYPHLWEFWEEFQVGYLLAADQQDEKINLQSISI